MLSSVVYLVIEINLLAAAKMLLATGFHRGCAHLTRTHGMSTKVVRC
jgi:hypothetical protein